jgi:hypothetical protein
VDHRQPDTGYDWVTRFDQVARERLQSAPTEMAALDKHPDFGRAVPTPDHDLTLLDIAGLAGDVPLDLLVDGHAAGSQPWTATCDQESSIPLPRLSGVLWQSRTCAIGVTSAPMAGREADAMTAPQIVSNSDIHHPLRLRLAAVPNRDRLDGAWWPYSRDLESEMSELVQQFPSTHAPISRAVYSRPDWDTAPRKVTAGPRVIKVGSFPRDDTHVLIVQLSDRRQLTLLVVPPDFTPGQGEEALLAGSTAGNRHTATELLLEVTDQHDADQADQWHAAEGGTRPTSGASHG